MVRTVVSLERTDKDWLDRQARVRRVTMTELVRTAVRRFREEEDRTGPGFDELLRRTSGLWKGEDGLLYQDRVRDGWERAR